MKRKAHSKNYLSCMSFLDIFYLLIYVLRLRLVIIISLWLCTFVLRINYMWLTHLGSALTFSLFLRVERCYMHFVCRKLTQMLWWKEYSHNRWTNFTIPRFINFFYMFRKAISIDLYFILYFLHDLIEVMQKYVMYLIVLCLFVFFMCVCV